MAAVNHPSSNKPKPAVPNKLVSAKPAALGVVKPAALNAVTEVPEESSVVNVEQETLEVALDSNIDSSELAEAEAEVSMVDGEEVSEVLVAVITEANNIIDKAVEEDPELLVSETVNTDVQTVELSPEVQSVAVDIEPAINEVEVQQVEAVTEIAVELPEENSAFTNTVNAECSQSQHKECENTMDANTTSPEVTTQVQEAPVSDVQVTDVKSNPGFFNTVVNLFVTLNTAHDTFVTLADQGGAHFESLKAVELIDKRTGLAASYDLKNLFIKGSSKSNSKPGLLRECFGAISNLIATFNNKQVMFVGEQSDVGFIVQSAVAKLQAKLVDTLPVHLTQEIVLTANNDAEVVLTLDDFISFRVWSVQDTDLADTFVVYVNLIINSPVLYQADQPDQLIVKVSNVLKSIITSSGIDLNPYLMLTFSSLHIVANENLRIGFNQLLETSIDDPLADEDEEAEQETVNTWEAISYRDVQEGAYDWVPNVNALFPAHSDLCLFKAMISEPAAEE